MKARVIRPWTRSYDNPLRVQAGEMVTIGRGDREYPGWVWCEDETGLGGWLPQEIVGPAAPGDDAQARRDFDTREMSVAEGEEVTIIARQSGWAMCRDEAGEEGWVPLDCLEEPEG